MANHDDEQESEAESQDAAEASAAAALTEAGVVASEAGSLGAADSAAAQLGVTRYVHVAFLGIAVLTAYIAGKLLETLWNGLANWPAATRQASWLLRYREDERPAFTMAAGLVVGSLFGLWLFKNVAVRRWADEVASELAKVHWPTRELVQNGTLIVVITGLFATVYVGLLDRLWVFVTTLVYGA